jgi:hypothetical protein
MSDDDDTKDSPVMIALSGLAILAVTAALLALADALLP